MIKILNLKLVILLEYQWSEEAFVIKKVKNTVCCGHITSDLKGEETVVMERISDLTVQIFWIDLYFTR